MMLAFALAAIAFAALLAVALPLLRPNRLRPGGLPPTGLPPGGLRSGGSADDGARFDRAVYRDQLRELDRDVARGLTTGAEAAATRLEIQRRLLATEAIADKIPNLARSPFVAAALAAIVGVGSIGLYLTIGTPEAPSAPFASRTDIAPGAKLAETAARLAERAGAEPSNKQVWLLYARAALASNDWTTAATAFKRAIDLGAREPDVLAAYGEMLVMQNRGAVTPVARETFEAIVNDDPGHVMARYYLAIEAAQAGDPQKGIALLQGVLADLPPDESAQGAGTQGAGTQGSGARAEVVRRMTEIASRAGLPPPRPAAGPKSDTAAAIAGMVDRLAERMDAHPDDLEGWLKLGRARSVQGQSDKAADAYERAATLKPDDVRIKLQSIDALLAGRAVAEALPPRAIVLLRQVEAISPEEPTALWYLGIVAAQDGQADKARGYWTRLLPKLAPGGEEAKLVRGAIDAVKAK